MRSRNYIFITIVFLAIFFICIPNAYAAVIIPYEEMPLIIILTIMFAFIINTIIEFGVVYFFLKSQFLDKKRLFYSVALVNIVLVPPIQTITYFIMLFHINHYVFYAILFGFLMVLIEWIFYRFEFQKLYFQKSIPETLTLKKTVLISSIANLASFSIIYLYPVITMIQ